MEEVWKGINLSSLTGPNSFPTSNTTSSFRNVILQDFLSHHPKSLVSSAPEAPPLFPSASPVPPPPHPPSFLSLNSGLESPFPDSPNPLRPNSSHLVLSQNVSNFITSDTFEIEGSDSAPPFPCFEKKRSSESDRTRIGDRRHKRMIKNRESAARSRARKQAYTNELELELAHLMEENARLRRQQEQLRLAVSVQTPKKKSLHRTLTAPF